MAQRSAPGWLVPAFARAAKGAGATASDDTIDRYARRLLDRWSAPERHYHNVRHLVELLRHVDELQQETHQPHAVRLAAWYHGAVFNAAESAAYARRGGEDEVASALVAREELAELGIPARTVEQIASMVHDLAGHSCADRGGDGAVLSDADLAVLASEPQRYKQYVAEVRREYDHIPDEDYREARRAIVAKLLARERLYTSPLGASWETGARQNLVAELARLDRDIKAGASH